MPDSDIVRECREALADAESVESQNRLRSLNDRRFTKLNEQWPKEVLADRERRGKPALTINKLIAPTNQVINDARQNRPAVRVAPVDDSGDLETAEIINGLIRNIEYASSADIAYDTALESAVDGGYGYIRVGIDHPRDDTFDLEVRIITVPDPDVVYGDPRSLGADSSDWNVAHVIEDLSKDDFEASYPDADMTSFDMGSAEGRAISDWFSDDTIRVAEYWRREKVNRDVTQLSDGSIIAVDKLQDPEFVMDLIAAGLTISGQIRSIPSFDVTRRIVSGAEVLETTRWPGRFIPIIPVYGYSIVVEGERHLFGMTHFARDSQQQLNVWTSASTDLVSKAPKTPYIGPEDAFKGTDKDKWATIGVEDHPFVSYKGDKAPERQPMDTQAIGAMSMASQANENIKAVLGIYDASLGAPGNEISGKAIVARQRESDTGNFQFQDNLSRAIRHTGRVIIDLVPEVYSSRRVVRILGEDGKPTVQKVNQPVPVIGNNGQPVTAPDPFTGEPRVQTRIFDLSTGRYDVQVRTGPSYATRREEQATQMIEFVKAFPQAAPVMGDLIAKALDWEGADELGRRLESLLPEGLTDNIPPQIAALLKAGKEELDQLKAKLEDKTGEEQRAAAELLLKQRQVEIDAYKAETDRLKIIGAARLPPGWYDPMNISPPPRRPSFPGMSPPMPGLPMPGGLPGRRPPMMSPQPGLGA